MTTLLYLMACLMSPAPLINLAESRVQGVVHKHSAIARGSIVSIVKYAVTLMAYSLKMFFQAHRAHHPQFLSPLLTGRALVPFRVTRLRGLCSNGAIMEGF